MKILLIGYGSIGKRHLRNILSLGYNNITVVSRSGKLPQELQALQVFLTLENALASSKFDTAIICTPTSTHVNILKHLLLSRVVNIYLEKPVSHSLEDTETIVELSESYSNKIVVGFDLHFDPGMQKVKELLKNDYIGVVISVNAQVGQYLPNWRPHEDYRNGMSAKKETGGGVMLDLVHEFDYLYWLLGEVNIIAALYKNSGALEIETEDVAEVLLQFKNGCIGTIHLDYLQQKLIRNCVITGSRGTITWDLAASKVTWIDQTKTESFFDYKEFERNDRFVSIMKAFLEGAKDERLTSLTDGLESLKMVVAAKQSSQTKKFVQLSSLNLLPV